MSRTNIARAEVVCACCGDLIAELEAGWFEWVMRLGQAHNGALEGFQIVHHAERCMYNTDRFKGDRYVLNQPLSHFAGAGGLQELAARVRQAPTVEGSSLGLVLWQLARLSELGRRGKP